jgi:hypothetical protein
MNKKMQSIIRMLSMPLSLTSNNKVGEPETSDESDKSGETNRSGESASMEIKTIKTLDCDKKTAQELVKQATTIKITSNAHSNDAAALGITFAWGARQKDDCLLTVKTLPTGSYYYFDLLIQSSGIYKIANIDSPGVYEVSKNIKNINMAYICNATLHKHVYNANTMKPTCTEQGFTKFICACGNSYIGDYTPAPGHDYNVGELIKESTCNEKGLIKYTCKRCGHTYTEQHTVRPPCENIEYKVTKEAACLTKGAWERRCTLCGELHESGDLPAFGHDYRDTFKEKGIIEDAGVRGVLYACSRCGDSYIRGVVVKTGFIPFRSNAVGENAVGEYYEQTEKAASWNSDALFGKYSDYFMAPEKYVRVVGLTGAKPAQYIWDKPDAEVMVGDEAVVIYYYELPKALSRKIIDYVYVQSNGVGIFLNYAFDAYFKLYINDHLINSSENLANNGIYPNVHSGFVMRSTECDRLKEAVSNTACDAVVLRFELANTWEAHNGTEKAMVIFAGGIAYEYEVFAD